MKDNHECIEPIEDMLCAVAFSGPPYYKVFKMSEMTMKNVTPRKNKKKGDMRRVIDKVELTGVSLTRCGFRVSGLVVKEHFEPDVVPDKSISRRSVMDSEKIYIGTKIVKAIPMTGAQFYERRGQPYPVNKENSPGYQVTYADGYVSWSPADTFESCYRELSWQESGMVVASAPSKDMAQRVNQPDLARKRPDTQDPALDALPNS